MVGNPNAGKTTLFNALTGSHQKVGNYPGVTVERVSGVLRLPSGEVECTDVPGLYSLAPLSEDERVAVDVLVGRAGNRRPDLLVCVIDASNLERNLFLYTQVAEAGLPMLVALTMVDRLEAAGRSLDLLQLEASLGVPVVPLVGHRDVGIEQLRMAMGAALDSPKTAALDLPLAPEVEAAVDSRAVGSEIWTRAEIRQRLSSEGAGPSGIESDVQARYQWAKEVQKRCVTEPTGPRPPTVTDRIDRYLTDRFYGMLAFVGVMLVVFQGIYTVAVPFMDAIDALFGWLKGVAGQKLAAYPVWQSLVVDGVLAGVGAVVLFLPQILILFFFVAMLEGTGYLARAAFIMDRLLGWCGLNGRAFIPLLSSFACAIPGVMAARVMPDPKSRLATILVAPLMSCSARLPVYLLIIGALIEPRFGALWAGFALFAMHLLGLAVAIPVVWFLTRKVLRGPRLPFLLELPPYQMPKWKDVWIAMIARGAMFLRTSGTTIFAMSVMIWALSYFPRLDAVSEARILAGVPAERHEQALAEAHLAGSYLGRFGKAIEPAFVPLGFDWRITTSILAAFPARETVVPSLGIIFALGGEQDENSADLRKAMSAAKWPDGRPLFTVRSSIGLMVFFALCAQCFGTLAAVKRETNSWKWPLIMFVYMTLLAYMAAWLVNQVPAIFGG